MTEPLISISQLKKTSVEAIVAQDIDFLTKLQTDVTSFLSRITKDMQSSYLKYVRSKSVSNQDQTPINNWVFNFSVGDPRPEYHFLIVKTFRDQGYVIKKNELKQGYYLVSDVPFEDHPQNKHDHEPIRMISISPSAEEIKFDNAKLSSDPPSPQIKILSPKAHENNPKDSQPPSSLIIPEFKGLFEYVNQMTHKLAQLDQLFITHETQK
jgi:hypothetical protein